MILATAMPTKMEHAIQLKNVFKKVAQMKEVAHKAMVYVAHVSFVIHCTCSAQWSGIEEVIRGSMSSGRMQLDLLSMSVRRP